MVRKYKAFIENRSYVVVVSDEIQALLEAQAAGRAVAGVAEIDEWDMKGIPYVVPSWEDATEELLDLVLRRHLGLPWLIDKTERLIIREFVREDALCIPEEEYGQEEAVFRCSDSLALYIKNQYRFYEYGTWALVHRETGQLIGMAGVSNPRLPAHMEEYLEKLEPCQRSMGEEGHVGPAAWLELGYHIFKPWRGQGYGREAAAAVMCYSHEALAARLCALIHRDNQFSCRLAESLGMKPVMKDGLSGGIRGEQLLYVEEPLLFGRSYGILALQS